MSKAFQWKRSLGEKLFGKELLRCLIFTIIQRPSECMHGRKKQAIQIGPFVT
jgi:hypothetical protein